MSNQPSRHDVTRRDFIGNVALGTGGALALSGLLPSDAAAVEHSPVVTAAWDMSWVDRLTGKYRAVFDSPDFADGFAMTNASTFMAGFQEVYGVADADTQAVIVFRHIGVPMAFNDAMWEKYQLGEMHKLANAEKRNPWTNQITRLSGRGALFLACNQAANRLGGQIAQRMSADAATVRADILSNLVPGVTLMPSGIFAALRAQQAGCQFIKST